MTPRVLLLVEPGLNGVFRHVEGLCDYLLRQRTIKMALVYSSVRSSDALYLLVDRIRTAGHPVLDLNVGNAPGLCDLPALAALMNFVSAFRPSVIHSHSSKAGALARCLWWFGFSPHQFYTPNAYYGFNRAGGAMARVFNWAESVLGLVGYTINVSGSERSFSRARLGLPSGSLLLIPNAVDAWRFFPPTDSQRREERARLGLPAEAWVFGTVGRYSDQKDPQTLYRAVKLLLEADKNAWFAHLGEGEAFNEIDAMLHGQAWAKRVIRVRYDREPAAFYRALDVFVLSSRYEGLPISAIEALATGLPLVLTWCPGCEDFAKMGLNGVYWATIGRPATLVSALENAKTLRPRVLNHRDIAERRFGVDAVYGRIWMTYCSATSHGVCQVS